MGETVPDDRSRRPVRLDLAPADHERLERCARERDLSMASYARQAVLVAIRGDERELSGRPSPALPGSNHA